MSGLNKLLRFLYYYLCLTKLTTPRLYDLDFFLKFKYRFSIIVFSVTYYQILIWRKIILRITTFIYQGQILRYFLQLKEHKITGDG